MENKFEKRYQEEVKIEELYGELISKEHETVAALVFEIM